MRLLENVPNDSQLNVSVSVSTRSTCYRLDVIVTHNGATQASVMSCDQQRYETL